MRLPGRFVSAHKKDDFWLGRFNHVNTGRIAQVKCTRRRRTLLDHVERVPALVTIKRGAQ